MKHHFRNDQPFEEIYKENISVNINEIEKIKNKEFLEKKTYPIIESKLNLFNKYIKKYISEIKMSKRIFLNELQAIKY